MKNKQDGQMLNQLLADFHIHYQNLRNFHWNVKGSNFFTLHSLFEEWYQDINLKIDELAERILAIDQKPVSSYREFLSYSELREADKGLTSEEMIEVVHSDMKLIAIRMKRIVNDVAFIQDIVTHDMLTQNLQQFEKKMWMCDSYLKSPVNAVMI